MKKRHLIVTILIVSIHYTSIAQNLTVEYDVKRQDKMYKNILSINDSVSTWIGNTADENNSSYNDLYIIKNRLSNYIYYNEILFGKPFYIKDTLHNMSWQITSDTISILNHVCISAKTQFRGRDYTAYFTTDIPYSDGPWKFGGLPGIILKIKSDDAAYEYLANKIENKKQQNTKQFNTSKTNFITWDNFQKKFIEAVDNIVKKVKSSISGDNKGYIKIDAPEIIYPKVQTNEGIEY